MDFKELMNTTEYDSYGQMSILETGSYSPVWEAVMSMGQITKAVILISARSHL